MEYTEKTKLLKYALISFFVCSRERHYEYSSHSLQARSPTKKLINNPAGKRKYISDVNKNNQLVNSWTCYFPLSEIKTVFWGLNLIRRKRGLRNIMTPKVVACKVPVWSKLTLDCFTSIVL